MSSALRRYVGIERVLDEFAKPYFGLRFKDTPLMRLETAHQNGLMRQVSELLLSKDIDLHVLVEVISGDLLNCSVKIEVRENVLVPRSTFDGIVIMDAIAKVIATQEHVKTLPRPVIWNTEQMPLFTLGF